MKSIRPPAAILSLIKDQLSYDPASGAISRLWSLAHNAKIGGDCSIIVGLHKRVVVGGREVKAHLIAWFLKTGEWPDFEVDHHNTDGHYNAWSNLRPASTSENMCNAKVRCDNRLGLKGVTPFRGRFRARIRKDKRLFELGIFDTADAAHAAYCAASIIHHGEFGRTQ